MNSNLQIHKLLAFTGRFDEFQELDILIESPFVWEQANGTAVKQVYVALTPILLLVAEQRLSSYRTYPELLRGIEDPETEGLDLIKALPLSRITLKSQSPHRLVVSALHKQRLYLELCNTRLYGRQYDLVWREWLRYMKLIEAGVPLNQTMVDEEPLYKTYSADTTQGGLFSLHRADQHQYNNLVQVARSFDQLSRQHSRIQQQTRPELLLETVDDHRTPASYTTKPHRTTLGVSQSVPLFPKEALSLSDSKQFHSSLNINNAAIETSGDTGASPSVSPILTTAMQHSHTNSVLPLFKQASTSRAAFQPVGRHTIRSSSLFLLENGEEMAGVIAEPSFQVRQSILGDTPIYEELHETSNSLLDVPQETGITDLNQQPSAIIQAFSVSHADVHVQVDQTNESTITATTTSIPRKKPIHARDISQATSCSIPHASYQFDDHSSPVSKHQAESPSTEYCMQYPMQSAPEEFNQFNEGWLFQGGAPGRLPTTFSMFNPQSSCVVDLNGNLEAADPRQVGNHLLLDAMMQYQLQNQTTQVFKAAASTQTSNSHSHKTQTPKHKRSHKTSALQGSIHQVVDLNMATTQSGCSMPSAEPLTPSFRSSVLANENSMTLVTKKNDDDLNRVKSSPLVISPKHCDGEFEQVLESLKSSASITQDTMASSTGGDLPIPECVYPRQQSHPTYKYDPQISSGVPEKEFSDSAGRLREGDQSLIDEMYDVELASQCTSVNRPEDRRLREHVSQNSCSPGIPGWLKPTPRKSGLHLDSTSHTMVDSAGRPLWLNKNQKEIFDQLRILQELDDDLEFEVYECQVSERSESIEHNSVSSSASSRLSDEDIDKIVSQIRSELRLPAEPDKQVKSKRSRWHFFKAWLNSRKDHASATEAPLRSQPVPVSTQLTLKAIEVLQQRFSHNLRAVNNFNQSVGLLVSRPDFDEMKQSLSFPEHNFNSNKCDSSTSSSYSTSSGRSSSLLLYSPKSPQASLLLPQSYPEQFYSAHRDHRFPPILGSPPPMPGELLFKSGSSIARDQQLADRCVLETLPRCNHTLSSQRRNTFAPRLDLCKHDLSSSESVELTEAGLDYAPGNPAHRYGQYYMSHPPPTQPFHQQAQHYTVPYYPHPHYQEFNKCMVYGHGDLIPKDPYYNSNNNSDMQGGFDSVNHQSSELQPTKILTAINEERRKSATPTIQTGRYSNEPARYSPPNIAQNGRASDAGVHRETVSEEDGEPFEFPPPPIDRLSSLPAIVETIYDSFLLHYESSEIARELTLIDRGFLIRIDFPELLAIIRQSPNNWWEVYDPVLAVIKLSERLSNLFVSEILRCQQKNVQVDIIHHLIQAADVCRKIQSFNALWGIVEALTSHPLARLGFLWRSIQRHQPQTYRLWRNLREITQLKGVLRPAYESLLNKAVRNHTRRGHIPFLGLLLKQLFYTLHPTPSELSLSSGDPKNLDETTDKATANPVDLVSDELHMVNKETRFYNSLVDEIKESASASRNAMTDIRTREVRVRLDALSRRHLEHQISSVLYDYQTDLSLRAHLLRAPYNCHIKNCITSLRLLSIGSPGA